MLLKGNTFIFLCHAVSLAYNGLIILLFSLMCFFLVLRLFFVVKFLISFHCLDL